MRFVALQSIVCTTVVNLSGCFTATGVRCFQRLRVAFRRAGPRTLASSGSSSHARRPLQSMSPLHTRTAPAGLCTFREVWLSIATPAREVHLQARFPPSPTFRPQRFSRSRRFTPSRTLQVCFALLPRTRFTLQGLFPAAEPARLSPHCPLVLFNDFRLQPGCPDCPALDAPTSGF
jgi:hypothetical protein